MEAAEGIARIRTSDRILFRRCRRRWGWQAELRGNKNMLSPVEALWLGTGFHYALEDFHGYNQYGDPGYALIAFAEGCRRLPSAESVMPDTWREALALGVGMMDYYKEWLQARDPLQTYWHEGVPQVEVRFEIELPIPDKWKHVWKKVIYNSTIDRIAIDEYGRLWVVEYKTAKAFQVHHFLTDAQITAYVWAAKALYNKPIAGVVYMQFKKALPHEPRLLKTGRFSTNKQQNTTRILYKKALLNMYGDLTKVPTENQVFLNYLATQETDEADKFIRRDFVERNQHQIEAEGVKIQLELEEMLDPHLPLYPNPTRECSWSCPFHGACVNLDAGLDFEYELEALKSEPTEEGDSWRLHLPHPSQVPELAERLYPLAQALQDTLLSEELLDLVEMDQEELTVVFDRAM